MGDHYGLSLVQIAQVAWIVYLAADFGSVGGGLLSGFLVRRGIDAQRSRLLAMSLAALLGPLGMVIATGVGVPFMLALAAVVAFGHLVFQVNLTSLVIDRYPQHAVATVFGVIAAGSGLGGILSTQVVGELVGSTGYEPLFVMMGCAHPLACALAWWAGEAKDAHREQNKAMWK